MMEELVIINELILILYCISTYIRNKNISPTLMVCNIVIYVILKMIFYISKDKKVRKYLVTFLTIYSLISTYYIDNIFLILFPINYYSIMYYFKLSDRLNWVIMIFVMVLLKEKLYLEFVLILAIEYITYKFVLRLYKKLNKLTEENDKLREKNDFLYKKLKMDIEYQNSFKYVLALEERNKISQKMHDDIGHVISGSLMQLEAAKLLIDKDSKKSKQIVENNIMILRNGMDKIRETLRNIKPSREEMGINKIKLLLNKFKIRSGLTINFTFDNEVNIINNIQWKVIYDSINEALTNVMKHSNATKVKANIQVLNKLIKVEIKDNGIGASNIKKIWA